MFNFSREARFNLQQMNYDTVPFFSVISVFLCYLRLQGNGNAQHPSVLDFGTESLLEHVTGAVAAVNSKAIIGQGAIDIKGQLVLLDTAIRHVVVGLVDLIMGVALGINVPVHGSSQCEVEFFPEELLELERKLDSPDREDR